MLNGAQIKASSNLNDRLKALLKATAKLNQAKLLSKKLM